MKQSLMQPIFVWMLGTLVVLGLSLSTIPTGEMSKMVSVAGSMSDTGKMDCDGCAGGDAKMLVCNSFCIPPVLMALPQMAAIAVPPRATFFLETSARLASWRSAPDPSPPRTVVL
jgi:hypothetical protein